MARPCQKAILILYEVIGPTGMSQSIPNHCVQPGEDPSTPSCCRLLSVCLDAYNDQWDPIMSNSFVRSVVQNSYALEFAEGNSPLLSRVPIAFKSTQVGLSQKLLNIAFLKLLEKGVIEPV